ncbi:MAG: YiaA/YiaB family inner membrane protein [Jatrophihabitans sp.]|uniref:YiaA/YiaB family inner membrane protein n=1 Tax=Jatrophihabitans sp. TaxID=1932789 RepID=UPI003F7EFB66
MTTPTAPKNTTAFYAQAAIAFGLALMSMLIGEWYLPLSGWARAFLALGTVFLTSSCFTLAKCVRDAQESGSVISRLDQARLERLLAEFDPYAVPHLAKAWAQASPAGETVLADRAATGLTPPEPRAGVL